MKSKHTMEEEVKTLRLQLKLALAHFSQDREGEVKREEQVSPSLPPSLHLPLSHTLSLSLPPSQPIPPPSLACACACAHMCLGA
jgi:hypothetical protein